MDIALHIRGRMLVSGHGAAMERLMKRLWLTGLLLGAALCVAGIAIEWPAGKPVAVAAPPSNKAPQRIVPLNLCADQYLLRLPIGIRSPA